jgi:ubiquitin C-terminal hydrolase
VHSGQANEGHYYSLFKDSNSNSNSSSPWLKFDDSRVTPFSSSQI